MSVKLETGKWSPPVNLGDSINTGGNEMAPFLHADGKTLYYSSDGHDGLGGSDLFISRKDETGQWSKAQNLGSPVNTKYNEINMFVSLDGQMAYLSSDKPGGEGGFDIYEFETNETLRPSLVYFVKGIVKDKETEKPLESEVTLADLSRSLVVDKSISDKQTGEFLMVLQHDIEYAFNISKTNYLFYSDYFNFNDSVNKSSVEKVFYLEPVKSGKSVVLENVFFDFNKSELKPKSFSELNKLLKLLDENPDIKILISGHTDDVGSVDYNMELSEERAKVVFQYLVEKGIASDRLTYKGFGASKPVSDNTSEDGRSRNRRTEIKVL
jgi:outer membrane protein OmpA-like peptidoglycan-associated protein